MSDLIGRLEAIGSVGATGDWLDVVTRAERERSQTLRRRLLVAVAVAVLAVPAIAIATHYWDVLSLSATEEEIPLPEGESTLGYVIGDRLQLPGRPPTKLAARLLAAPYLYPASHLVVPSPDRRRVVYQTWQGNLQLHRGRPQPGAPVVRLFDADSGRDVIVARGAHSPAWRADGVLAYTRALVPEWRPGRQGSGQVGHIVVRQSWRHPSVRWSTFASAWSDLAWAGRHLIAQTKAKLRMPFRNPDADPGTYSLYAFSAPGRGRRLPLQSLIAISPDGRLVLGRTSTLGERGGEPLLRLVDVRTGQIIVTLDRSDAHGSWSLDGLGTWSGETIIMTSGFAPQLPDPGHGGLRILPGPDHVKVVVLRYSDGKLVVERELRLSRDVIQATGLRADQFYFGFSAPVFVDKAARQFTAELVVENTVARRIETMLVYLTCDRMELRCRRGRSLTPRSITWSSLVNNPSRPLPD